MKKDSSRLLHDKYFRLTNGNIEVILRNGTTIKGVIVGFYMSDDDTDVSPISMWHLIEKKDKAALGVDGLGFMKGELIRHRSIAEVHFEEDNSIMKF